MKIFGIYKKKGEKNHEPQNVINVQGNLPLAMHIKLRHNELEQEKKL